MTALETIEDLAKHGYNIEISRAYFGTLMKESNFINLRLSYDNISVGVNLNPGEFSREEYISGKLRRMQNEIKDSITRLK